MSTWETANFTAIAELPTAATQFSYEAAETRKQRKQVAIDQRSEDWILDRAKRDQVQANARDIARNFAIACWMIRRHLDYCCTFDFHARSGNDAVDGQLETLMRTWQRRHNCDAARRHRFRKLIRLAEVRRVIDGDMGFLKLRDGRLQGIESDLIKNPTGTTGETFDPAEWVQGVRVGTGGRAWQYSLYKRQRIGALAFDRIVEARNLLLHGFFDRFDQYRGISPIVAALNPLRDVYENFNYALAKAKVTQLFAMVIESEIGESIGQTTYTGDADEPEKDKYEVDFGRGPIKLELDAGDKADFLESKHPSTEFQHFTQLVIAVALKALDIPYSFYDEAHTNFFGSRAAWLHYERSCEDKRDDIAELLEQITRWRMALWLADGDLAIPAGWRLDDIRFEWVPKGMPWWDPAKEVRGDIMAIAGGLDNPQRICKERGRGDFYDNIDQIAEAQAYAREKGVDLSFAVQPEINIDAASAK